MSNRRIRKVSIDKFYEIVTGENDAFYQVCMALPGVINDVINESGMVSTPHDTVYEELSEVAKDYNDSDTETAMMMAMYMLGFSEYNGFSKQ